jgi:3-oxoadipate enol-lactonase
MQEKSLESFDGTRIVYQVGGEGDRWFVVANGYGGSFFAWEDLFDILHHDYRLLVWDYRGLYRSAIPADRTLLRVHHNCLDLDEIRVAEGIDTMVLAGWSVGVQVALEQYRRTPRSVEALVLINGAHGRVLHRSFTTRLERKLIPPTVRGLRRAQPILQPTLLPVLRQIAKRNLAATLLHKGGLFARVSPSIRDAIHGVLTLDYDVYFKMGLLADEHDTADFLPRIRIPTMVIAGTDDRITRPPLARSIARAIPGAVYHEIPRATHYGVMEFPETYAQHIREFIRGLPASGRAAVQGF